MHEDIYRVRVIDRALSIVDLLSAMEQYRYVERDVLPGRYRLGLKLAELNNIAVSRFDLQQVVRPA